MNYKYAALFVLYNPSEEEIKRIISFSSLYDIIYVYDNTEKEIEYIEYLKLNGVYYYGFGSNDGLSKAYNYIIDQAIKDNIDWLSIYDQDSQVTDDMIHCLKEYAENCKRKKIASLVPAIQYEDNSPNIAITKEVLWAINSGQMLNLKSIEAKKIRYDENIFLDRVDKDFCKQIELSGLKIVQVKNALLKQRLGERYNGYTVHSPIRNYYMYKNRLYYNYKYYGRVRAFILNCMQSGKHIVNVIRSRKDVNNNLIMMRLARKDYKANRMGRRWK